MDPVDRQRIYKGTAFACAICKHTVLGFKKRAFEERQSVKGLKESIECFRVTTCQPCRDDIISTPKTPDTKIVLLPARERPVARQTIAGWNCYRELSEYLGHEPEIYHLDDWGVIEDLHRIKEEMGDNYIVLQYERLKDGIKETGIDFFVSNKPWAPNDAMLENTRINTLEDACLGCVQCPAILPLVHGQDPTVIWFRPTTCQRCRATTITTGGRLCPVGDVLVGGDLIKALPSFRAATDALGTNMKLPKAQGFCVIESLYILIGQYVGGRRNGGNFF